MLASMLFGVPHRKETDQAENEDYKEHFKEDFYVSLGSEDTEAWSKLSSC